MARRNKRANDSQVWRKKTSRIDKWSKHGLPANAELSAGKPGEPASLDLSNELSCLYTSDREGVRY